MAHIVDRRGSESATGSSKKNRQRFIDKNRAYIKKKVTDALRNKSIKDLGKDEDVSISVDSDEDMEEHSFSYDRSAKGLGDYHIIQRENKRFNRGDSVDVPGGSGGSGGGKGGKGDDPSEDAYEFLLTREEFTNMLFEGLELPNFTKIGEKVEVEKELQRAGYSKEGIPARLDIFKTLEQSIARRLATKKGKKKPAFLDEEDLRYKHFAMRDKPCRVAHIYFMMDVSGSVNEDQKDLAKRFFLLFYMFLQKQYKKVGITFIRYHSVASICTEQEFFYSKETGGTWVQSAYELLEKDIVANRNLLKENIYLAHSSDGDLGWEEKGRDVLSVAGKVIEKYIQYAVYVDCPNGSMTSPLHRVMNAAGEVTNKVGTRALRNVGDTIAALQELFRKRGN